MARFIAFLTPVVFVLLLAGWASAEEMPIPPGYICRVVSTTIRDGKKPGTTEVVTKKVCSKDGK